MTAETKDFVSVDEGSKIEAKSGASPLEDRPPACNGIAGKDGNEEIKDDGEASYVFINGDSDDGAETDRDADRAQAGELESNAEPRESYTENGFAGGEGFTVSEKQVHGEALDGEVDKDGKEVVVGLQTELSSFVEVGASPGCQIDASESVQGEGLQSTLEASHPHHDTSALDENSFDNGVINQTIESGERPSGAPDAETLRTDTAVEYVEGEEMRIDDSGPDSQPVKIESGLESLGREETLINQSNLDTEPVKIEGTIGSSEREENILDASNLDMESLKIEAYVSFEGEEKRIDDSKMDSESVKTKSASPSVEREETMFDNSKLDSEILKIESTIGSPRREASVIDDSNLDSEASVGSVRREESLIDDSKPDPVSIITGAAMGPAPNTEATESVESVVSVIDDSNRDLATEKTEATVGSVEREESAVDDSNMDLATEKTDSTIGFVDLEPMIDNSNLDCKPVGTVAIICSSEKEESDATLSTVDSGVSVIEATVEREEPVMHDFSLYPEPEDTRPPIDLVERKASMSYDTTELERGTISASSEHDESVSNVSDDTKLDSGPTNSADTEKLIIAEPEGTNLVDEGANDSRKSRVQGGNVNTHISIESGELVMSVLDSRKFHSENTDIPVETKTLKEDTGNAAEVTGDLPSEVGDVSVEAGEVTALSSLEERNPEAEPEMPSLQRDDSVSELNVGDEETVASSQHEPGLHPDDVKAASDSSTISVTKDENQLPRRDNDKNHDSEYPEGCERVAISPGEESIPALEGEKAEMDAMKKLPNYIVRVPRYVDDDLRAKINQAQSEVNHKTEERDSIRVSLQIEKATCAEYWDKVLAARAEERAARNAVNAKFKEIDSVQLIINRVKNATSIEEIDEKLHGMKHMIEHETMPLKEEKQLIREIKQLKQFRDQLSANMGTQADVQEAFDQRDSIDKRLKLLRQELDYLRSELVLAEANSKAAKKKHSDECESLNNLQAQFRDADSLRQQAYAEFQDRKRQMYQKSKYFHMYKDDQKAAADLASAGDREALWCFCNRQVEKFMELWNQNDEFRNEYVKSNMMSTLRRFRTLDCRSLGPDEEPPVILRNTGSKNDPAVATTSPDISSTETTTLTRLEAPVAPVTPENTESEPVVDVSTKSSSTKSKKTKTATAAESDPATGSGGAEKPEDDVEKEAKLIKEKELAQKEEELTRQEAEARLKEERRLEDIVKAKEAEERKRKTAERAKARAELKAKKEAELKEKAREKKARKKERKRLIQAEGPSGNTAEESSQLSPDEVAAEPVLEPEDREKPATVVTRYSKAVPRVKTKTLPPLPLRSRGKRRMQPWMWWAIFAVALLIVVFLVVNNIYSSSFNQSNV